MSVTEQEKCSAEQNDTKIKAENFMKYNGQYEGKWGYLLHTSYPK